jgi:hypothetical protein
MLEQYAVYVLALAALVGVAAHVWLIVRAFREGWGWGFAVLLIPGAGLVFVCVHFRKAVGPVCLFVAAGALFGAPYAASYYERNFMPSPPYEQIVDGELRITLTGLKDFDYATLKEKPQTVVLQMANADVDDQTLEHLKGMAQLRELDLNGTRVTDRGLAVIATLPVLKTLRVARTKISDEGFRTHLFAKESLERLDLTSTEVKGKTKREWKKQRPAEREYVD